MAWSRTQASPVPCSAWLEARAGPGIEEPASFLEPSSLCVDHEVLRAFDEVADALDGVCAAVTIFRLSRQSRSLTHTRPCGPIAVSSEKLV